jgi:hypothetical protein
MEKIIGRQKEQKVGRKGEIADGTKDNTNKMGNE